MKMSEKLVRRTDEIQSLKGNIRGLESKVIELQRELRAKSAQASRVYGMWTRACERLENVHKALNEE